MCPFCLPLGLYIVVQSDGSWDEGSSVSFSPAPCWGELFTSAVWSNDDDQQKHQIMLIHVKSDCRNNWQHHRRSVWWWVMTCYLGGRVSWCSVHTQSTTNIKKHTAVRPLLLHLEVQRYIFIFSVVSLLVGYCVSDQWFWFNIRKCC